MWVRSIDTPPVKKDSLLGSPFFLLFRHRLLAVDINLKQ